jgi:hypothetical protein
LIVEVFLPRLGMAGIMPRFRRACQLRISARYRPIMAGIAGANIYREFRRRQRRNKADPASKPSEPGSGAAGAPISNSRVTPCAELDGESVPGETMSRDSWGVIADGSIADEGPRSSEGIGEGAGLSIESSGAFTAPIIGKSTGGWSVWSPLASRGETTSDERLGLLVVRSIAVGYEAGGASADSGTGVANAWPVSQSAEQSAKICR